MGPGEGEVWFDQDAGPLIRPFALTRGRARADRPALNMITLVLAARSSAEAAALNRESTAIVEMCQARPLSVAEIAARMNMILMVAKVLVGDLIDDGFLVCRTAPTPRGSAPDIGLLQAVLNGIRKL